MSFVQDEEKPVVRERRTEYYEDGRAIKFLYECVGNDKDGKEELYYPSGKLNRVRNWKRGTLDGEMIVYHSNGNVYIRGNYKNGSLVGEYTVFKDNGDLLTIKQY
jgi:antitoxin component YwqK of YwqJK toxin-antitoxin module